MRCHISALVFKDSIGLPFIKDRLPASFCDHDLQQQPCLIRSMNPSITRAETRPLRAARHTLELAFTKIRVIMDLSVFRTKCKHYLLCLVFSQHTHGEGEINDAPAGKKAREFYFLLRSPFNKKAPKITQLEHHFYLINHGYNLAYKSTSIFLLSRFTLAIFSMWRLHGHICIR